MSYQQPYPPQASPTPAPAPEPRERPTVVTLAGALMMVTAGLALIGAIVILATVGQVVDRFRGEAELSNASRVDIDNLATGIQALMIGTAVLMVIGALVLVGLAFGVLHGSNVARILTWLATALGLVCGCCGILSTIGQTNVTSFGTANTNNQIADDLGRALQDAYPTWWLVFNGSLSALQMLGYIAIAVLLAMPAANEYFRRQPPQWQPPPPTR